MGGVFNTVNFHLYHYAANNPIHYIDPDGNDVTNKTDDYIIARPEDKITLKDGTKIDTVVLAPGDKYISGIDGTRDKEGNYTKVSANHKNIVNYTVEKNNIIKFDDEKSKKINDRNDMIKKINNLPAINKRG